MIQTSENPTSMDGRRGLTLLELMVVLVILIATALIVVPTFNNIEIKTPSGESQSPTMIATQATMNTVRQAIAGENGVIESLSHKSNALPRALTDLVQEEAPQHMLETAPELKDYDPVAKIGWKGPYLNPTGQTKTGEPTVVDGWGNELEIQVDFDEDGQVDPTESKYIRVVSAGPNGQIETPADVTNMKPGKDETSELTLSECGDDLVLFLRFPDNRK
ncbi:MAG: prepilin-type N-terminal cleavage/methylation domain-containing protein [Planctomycetota bacterium]